MKRTQFFIQTSKYADSDAVTMSHKLLCRGGFIKQVSTGRFAMLPLGYRVFKKLIKIIEEEMDAIGSCRMELPIMQPIEIWKVTNRDTAFGDEMVIVEDRGGRKFALSATAEALMTELFGAMNPSYKDLPINVYQFLPKFRDELRPRGGLIRVREFLMKDAYNFEVDEESFLKTYDNFYNAYLRVFERLNLEAIPVLADNGALGGDYSHEFMIITPDEVQPIDMYLDKDEKEEKLEIIDASKDEKVFNSILSFYKKYPQKTLKNMVYVINDNAYICITIRGDYKVDFVKLKKILKYKSIRSATSSELEELGTCLGYVSSMGINSKVKVFVDESVQYNKNYYDGDNKGGVFKKNVNYGRDIIIEKPYDIHEDKTINAGGDKIVVCDKCEYKANVEKAEFLREKVNMDETIKTMETVNQPEWVCTMEDNVEHYKKPVAHFLKNVVYKTIDGKLIIAAIRGDLDANATKISNILNCGELEMAADEDLEKIDTKHGWVHSWGHNAVYVADESLKVSKNLIGGQKQKDKDTINVNYGIDFEHEYEGDIVDAYDGAKCKMCKEGVLKEKKGVEVGHIFKYDDYYSHPHKAFFTDKDGKKKPMIMGAYGIGIGRTMATCVEMFNDEFGIIWPRSIAPFDVILVNIGDSKEVLDVSKEIHEGLGGQGTEVLWDDREACSPGIKFADADLIGIPFRIVVSERNLKDGKVEIKFRGSKDSDFLNNDLKSIAKFIKEYL